MRVKGDQRGAPPFLLGSPPHWLGSERYIIGFCVCVCLSLIRSISPLWVQFQDPVDKLCGKNKHSSEHDKDVP